MIFYFVLSVGVFFADWIRGNVWTCDEQLACDDSTRLRKSEGN